MEKLEERKGKEKMEISDGGEDNEGEDDNISSSSISDASSIKGRAFGQRSTVLIPPVCSYAGHKSSATLKGKKKIENKKKN